MRKTKSGMLVKGAPAVAAEGVEAGTPALGDPAGGLGLEAVKMQRPMRGAA